jgi:hypothetical protein
MPVGQLEGGHIAYAIFGRRRAEMSDSAAFFLLLVLGIFYWSGWLTWAILIFFLTGFKHKPALNEGIELNVGRRLLGAFAFLLFVLIMAPVPHQFMQALGLPVPIFSASSGDPCIRGVGQQVGSDNGYIAHGG